MYPVDRNDDDDKPVPVVCWNCERVTMSATGHISCLCGCSQGVTNAPARFQGSYDPEFAATASCP